MVKLVSFRFLHCLIPFTRLLVAGSPETRLFRHLSKNVFWNPSFRKYTSNEGHLFLKVLKILSTFQKWTKKKMEKNLFHFLSIASELAALNCLY